MIRKCIACQIDYEQLKYYLMNGIQVIYYQSTKINKLPYLYSYTSISVLSTAYRVMKASTINVVEEYIENVMGDKQEDFKQFRSDWLINHGTINSREMLGV